MKVAELIRFGLVFFAALLFLNFFSGFLDFFCKSPTLAYKIITKNGSSVRT